jgi:hypothetical protein
VNNQASTVAGEPRTAGGFTFSKSLSKSGKTVRRQIARGLEPPAYGPRPPRPRSTDTFLPYLRERLAAYPGLTAVRLWRELRERGYKTDNLELLAQRPAVGIDVVDDVLNLSQVLLSDLRKRSGQLVDERDLDRVLRVGAAAEG